MLSDPEDDLWNVAEAQFPYEPQPEDSARGFMGLFFFSWLNPVMQGVSQEAIQSPDELPGPVERFRVLTTGRRLARALDKEKQQRHAWDAYIGGRVTLRHTPDSAFFSLRDDETTADSLVGHAHAQSSSSSTAQPDAAADPIAVHTGTLKYIGYVHSFRTPKKLYAGITWDTGYAPPPQYDTSSCCGRRWWRRFLSCGCAGRIPRALRTRLYHDGTIGNEVLFSLHEDGPHSEDEVVLATCEPLENVRLCPPSPPNGEPLLSSDASSQGPLVRLPPRPQPVSLVAALFRALGPILWVLGPLRILVALIAMVSPLILKRYLRHLRTAVPKTEDGTAIAGEADWGEGLWLVFLFFASSSVYSLIFSKFEQMVTRCALTFRGALCSVVFEKCLTIAPKYLQLPSLNTGRVINMVSNDVQQAQTFCYLFWYTVCAPLQIGCATYMVCQMVGARATFAAIAVYAVFMPIELLLSRLVHFCYVKRITATDARLKRLEEFFSGIRTAKFMSWEPFFVKQIEQCRAEEMRWLHITQWMWTMVNLLTSFVPTLATAAMFVVLTFWPSNGDSAASFLTPETIFPALSALALLEAPFSVIPVLLYGYVRFYIAMKRLAAFIECEDATPVPSVSATRATHAMEEARVQATLHDLVASGERTSARASQQLWTDLAARFTGATVAAFQPSPRKPSDDSDAHHHSRRTSSSSGDSTSSRSSSGDDDDARNHSHAGRARATGVHIVGAHSDDINDDGHEAAADGQRTAPHDAMVTRASAIHRFHRTASSMALPLSHSTHALHLDDGTALQRALEAAAESDVATTDVDDETLSESSTDEDVDALGLHTGTASSVRASQHSQRSRLSRRRRGKKRHVDMEDYILKPLPILHDVTAEITKGSLTVVVGATGSGRSTFLKSLLGAYEVTHGSVEGLGATAYVSQPVWIFGGTVRENITFFADTDGKDALAHVPASAEQQRRLETALACTQLTEEVQLLPRGLETEIGARGISLSGGQKARVNLARAVYADKELYLLDDPLSALDPYVGECVMRDCILGALRTKTRVMTMHHASLLHHADRIIYLRAGRVVFQGSYPAYKRFAQNRANWDLRHAASSAALPDAGGFLELVAADLVSRVDLAALSGAHSSVPPSHVPSDTEAEADGDEEDDRIDGVEASSPLWPSHTDNPIESHPPPLHRGEATTATMGAAPGALSQTEAAGATPTPLTSSTAENADSSDAWVVQEERASGRVPWSVYKRYGEACGGLAMLIVVSLVFVVTECAAQSSSLFLSLWSTHTFDAYLDQHASLYVYLACVFLGALSFSVRYGVCLTYARRGARRLHRACLSAVGTSCLAFFDRTPVGQLMNRFSRDVNIVDDDLQIVLLVTLSMFVGATANIGLMLVSQYFILVFLIPTALLFVSIARFYGAAARHVQRMVNTANTPLLSHLQEILAGRWVIGAFGKSATFLCEALRRIDAVFACDYMRSLGECWLNVRMSLVSSLLLTGMALIGVLSVHLPWIHLNVGLLSLSLNSAKMLGNLLTRGVMSVADVEASMNSVERLLYCTDTAEPEGCGAPGRIDNAQTSNDETHRRQSRRSRAHRGGRSFQAGSLAFVHVDMRYRDGLPLVLRDVSFAISPGQKVGVVGRTGSGKSTLLLAFLRLVEVCGGRMVVNGRDAREYDLRDLRLLFSMIPQDPLLFDGTVRSNVDPFGESSDGAVWGALRHVGMAERVRGEAGGLDCRVQEGGSNFSVGQRQLLCLARALLKRGSAFLLMDEATANVDPALDRQIQRTVHDVFAAYTVVTIAHRLHTVAQYDVILVMDGGRVLESGSPRELVARADSHFAGLVRSMGVDAQTRFIASLP